MGAIRTGLEQPLDLPTMNNSCAKLLPRKQVNTRTNMDPILKRLFESREKKQWRPRRRRRRRRKKKHTHERHYFASCVSVKCLEIHFRHTHTHTCFSMRRTVVFFRVAVRCRSPLVSFVIGWFVCMKRKKVWSRFTYDSAWLLGFA